MFDFSRGYFTPEQQPIAPPLNLVPTQDIQLRGFGDGLVGGTLGAIMGGDTVSVPSPNPLFWSDQFWTHDQIKTDMTNAEHSNLEKLLNIMDSGSHDPAAGIGMANDPMVPFVYRQLMGQAPNVPMQYARSELTQEALASDMKYRDELMANPQAADSQEQIKAINKKLAYAAAIQKTDQTLGFNWWDQVKATNPFNLFGMLGSQDAEAGKLNDIVSVLSRKDPRFNPEAYWHQLTDNQPKFKEALLERGITPDSIEDSPNKEHALFRISNALIKSDVQQRLQRYTPSWWDKLKDIGAGIPEFIINSPTGITVGTGAAAIAGLFFVPEALAAAPEVVAAEGTAAAAESTFLSLSTAKNALSLYQLPLGLVPEWMMGSSYLSSIPLTMAAGGVAGGVGSYLGQANQIAFGAATLYANPNIATEISKSEMMHEAWENAYTMGIFHGVHGLLGDVAGAYKNATRGVLIDPETGTRLSIDKRFTFEGTRLGETINKFSKNDLSEASLVDMSPSERVKTDAILENKDITPTDVVKTATEHAERTETKEAMNDPIAAAGTPEDPGTRKYVGETLPQYISRMAGNRGMSNIIEVATEIARRTNDRAGKTLLEDTQRFSEMSVQDQVRTLLRAKDVIAAARKAEEESIGLPAERERAYDALESKRKQYIKNLGKRLNRLDFKELKAEVNGEKAKPTGSLPELLRTARDATKPLKERQAAATEAANQLLETAQVVAKAPKKAPQIRQEVPKEVLDHVDAVATENKITGKTSEETTLALRKSLMTGEKMHLESTGIGREITKAMDSNRMNPERVMKIKSIQNDHTKFMDIVEGNKENARKYYNFVNDLRDQGIIGDRERTLLLAAVAHLNFSKRGFDLKYEIGSVEAGSAGHFDADTKTITLSKNIDGSRYAALIVLHELGHSFVYENATGSAYMDMLRLFNQTTASGVKLLDLNVPHTDSFLDNRFFMYHLQNAEELFVESFSHVLLQETSEVMSRMKPIEVSALRSILGSIKKVILEVADVFGESDYYDSVGGIIDELTGMDERLKKNALSVSKMSDGFVSALINSGSYDEFLTQFDKYLEEKQVQNAGNVRRLTKAEYDLIKNTNDPALLPAVAVVKGSGKDVIGSSGKWTKDASLLVDAYSQYKQAQFNSMNMKLAYLMFSGRYEEMLKMDKTDRGQYLINQIFAIDSKKTFFDEDGRGDLIIIPATAEEYQLRWLPVNDKGPYNKAFLVANARKLLDVAGMPKEVRDQITSNRWLMKSPLANLMDHLDQHGLEDLTDYIEATEHANFVAQITRDGLFNINRKNISPRKKASKLRELEAFMNDAKFLKTAAPEQVIHVLGLKSDDIYMSQLIQAINEGKLNTPDLIATVMKDVDSGKLTFDGEDWGTKPVKATKEKPAMPNPEALAKLEAGDTPVTNSNLNSLALLVAAQLTEEHQSSSVKVAGFSALLEAILNPESGRRDTILSDYNTKELLVEYFMKGWKNAKKTEDKAGVIGKQSRDAAKNKSSEAPIGEGAGQQQIKGIDTDFRNIAFKDEGFDYLRKLHDEVLKETGQPLFDEQTLQYIDAVNAKGSEVKDKEIAAAMKVSAGRLSQIKAKIQETLANRLGYSREEVAAMSPKERQELAESMTDLRLETISKKEAPKIPEPKLPTIEKAKEAAKEIAAEMALKEKASDTEAPEVPVPTMEEPATPKAVVETTLFPMDPETPVVREDKVANAVVKGEDNLIKSVVNVETKKAFKLTDSFATPKEVFNRIFSLLKELYPKETAKIPEGQRKQFVIDLLKEKGYDSIIDGQGNELPLEKPKKVGTVKKVRKPKGKPVESGTIEKEVTLFSTDEEGAPVVSTETVAEPIKAPVGEVPVVDPTPESNADSVEVAPTVQVGESVVAKISEEDKMERKVNGDRQTLRSNGMDTHFLKLFTKEYWSSGFEKVKSKVMTPHFKQAWEHFVLINQFIADANRKIYGEDAMERFWAKVDELHAENVRRKVTKSLAPMSLKEVLDQAAKSMNEEGKPDFVRPVVPSEFKFIKNDADGNVRLSGKNKKLRAIADAALSEKPEPPPVPKEEAATAVPEQTVEPATLEKKPEPTDGEKVLLERMDQSESGTSRHFLFNNWFGRLFGGDSTEASGWWQKRAASVHNFLHKGAHMGATVFSPFNRIAFVARLMEDSRAQTAHLIAAGQRAFKTALQCKNDEMALVVRLAQSKVKMLKEMGNEPTRVKAVNDYLYDCLRNGTEPTREGLVAAGVPEVASASTLAAAKYHVQLARAINERMLYMERETGLLVTVDKNGIPLDPNKYAPVQFDHEALAKLSPKDFATAVNKLVAIRTATKLADNNLDMNTMIAMGWIDAKWDPESQTHRLFDKAREYSPSEGNNTFSKDTLLKLRYDENGKLLGKFKVTEGSRATLKGLLEKLDARKYFVGYEGDDMIIYRMPSKIEDLAPVDAESYREAVKGNTAMYSEYWRKWLNNKNLIEHEINELIAYKTKQYPYNREKFGETRPMFKLDPNNKTGITVRGLTPEEICSDPEIKKMFRTDFLEAYHHWLKGRYFQLAFQMEIDRMLGTKGYSFDKILKTAHDSTYNDLMKEAKENGWSQKQLTIALRQLGEGIQRLELEYRSHCDTLPYSGDESTLGQRAASAAIRWKYSAGFGVTHLGQLMTEQAKNYPEFYKIPRDIIDTMRFLIGDYRFQKSKALMSELGDMTAGLEILHTDLSNPYMNEVGSGPLSTDSALTTEYQRMRQRFSDSHGLGSLVTALELGGDAMHSIGSINALLLATKYRAKLRMQRELWAYINSDKIDRLLTNLQKPEVRAELVELNKQASKNISNQTKYWKRFAGIARESGFGFDVHDALMFERYGFTKIEQIQALRWAMKKLKAEDKDGRVNFNEMQDLVDMSRRQGTPEVNPDVLADAVSNYRFMIEDRVAREAANEGRGLARNIDPSAMNAVNRLWNGLVTYLRNFHDNNIQSFGNKNTMDYAMGGLVLTGVTAAVVSWLKEWMAGRDMKDITKEISDHPSEVIIRSVARTPILGQANTLVEAAMSGMSALNGGTYRFHGNPLVGGIGAVPTAVGSLSTDAYNTVAGPDMAHRIKGASDLLGFTELINTSPLAIPAKTLQDMGAIEHQSALGTLMDTVHKNPFPYMDKSAKAGSTPTPLNANVPPRNYAMENVMYHNAMEEHPLLQVPIPAQPMVRPVPKKVRPVNKYFQGTRGVSSILGDLLDRAE